MANIPNEMDLFFIVDIKYGQTKMRDIFKTCPARVAIIPTELKKLVINMPQMSTFKITRGD